MTASIVLAAQRRPDALRLALHAIADLDHPPLEVVVVANGNYDPRVIEVAREAGALIIIEAKAGLNRARNLGAKAAKGDVVAFLDDDGLPAAGWLSALMREFHDPSVIAVAGKVRPPALESIDDITSAFLDLSFSGGDDRIEVGIHTERWFELAHFGGVGVGANMAFRRSIFDDWRGFDERIGAGTLVHGGEEGKAFGQLVSAGYTLVYTPDALVIHPSILPSTREMAERYRSALTAHTAYLTLLLVELRGFRIRVVRYLLESMFGVRRTWRAMPPSTSSAPMSRIAKWIAFTKGPLLYVRSRL